MNPTIETVEWLHQQANEARGRFDEKTRTWWRFQLWVLFPVYASREWAAWEVAVDLWGKALRDLRAPTNRAPVARLRLVNLDDSSRLQ